VLQWQSPDSNHWNGQLLGYMIRYKPAGYPDSTRSYENITSFQYSVIHELTGLIYFQQYQLSVAAYNSRGLGVFSADISVRTSEGRPTAPPRNVRASAISSTSISVHWQPPSQQHINGIMQGYHVNFTSTFNDSARRTFHSNLTNMLGEQTAILTDLYKYTEYRLTVVCFTAAGEGPPSEPVHVRTLEDGKRMLSWHTLAFYMQFMYLMSILIQLSLLSGFVMFQKCTYCIDVLKMQIWFLKNFWYLIANSIVCNLLRWSHRN